MPRIRSLKPEFWEDERVAALSPWARLVFMGSWNHADDEGRLRWTPDYLNAALFMYDDHPTRKVDEWMAEIEAQGIVVPYTGPAGQHLAWLPNFHKHQSPNKPQPPKYPGPEDPGSGPCSRSRSGTKPGTRSRGRSSQEGKGGVRKGRESSSSSVSDTRAAVDISDDDEDPRVEEACRIAAQRRLEATPSEIGNPEGYVEAVTAKLLGQHGDMLREVAREHPLAIPSFIAERIPAPKAATPVGEPAPYRPFSEPRDEVWADVDEHGQAVRA